MKQKLLRVLAIVLMVMLLTSEFALAESFKAKVYTSSAKVYENNSTKSKVKDTLAHNTVVTVLAHKNGWAKITYGKDGSGFCQVSDLISSKKIKTYSNTKTKIYKTPSTAQPITTISVDYPLYRVGMSGNYWLVQDKDGAFTGYIKKNQLSSSRSNPFAVPNSKKAKFEKNGSTTTIPAAVKSNQFYLASTMNKAKWRDYMAPHTISIPATITLSTTTPWSSPASAPWATRSPLPPTRWATPAPTRSSAGRTCSRAT